MFSTLVLPTKREIMKMSEKELIEKLMKIYHKLEPELKQSHPQLLAKHIAGVFQRAEPKFDFQRAEPGGWGGKTLLQIIMGLLALIAAEGGTMPDGNICIGERCPPSGTPTITLQPPSRLCIGERCPPSGTPYGTPLYHDPPSSCTPSNMPSSSTTVAISAGRAENAFVSQAKKHLHKLAERKLSGDLWRTAKNYFSRNSHEITSNEIAEEILGYQEREQQRYKESLEFVFGKDGFFERAGKQFKILTFTEVTLDSLKINQKFLDAYGKNQEIRVETIINDTMLDIEYKIALTDYERAEISNRVTTIVKQPSFLAAPTIFSDIEEAPHVIFTKLTNRLISSRLAQEFEDVSKEEMKTIAALYLAANSRELIENLGQMGLEAIKGDPLKKRVAEESEKILQGLIESESANPNEIVILTLSSVVQKAMKDIISRASKIRCIVDQASCYLLADIDREQEERLHATLHAGRKQLDKEEEDGKKGWYAKIFENFQDVVATTTKVVTGTIIGFNVAVALGTFGLVLLAKKYYCGNNNNRLQDRPRPGDRRPTTRRRRPPRPRGQSPRRLRDQSPRGQSPPRLQDRQSPRTAPRRRQSTRRRGGQSPRRLRDRVRPTYN